MKRRKVEPSALTMTFQTPSVSGGSSEQLFIDLSQCASLLNRRFYRQGLNWAVSGIKVSTSGDGVLYTQKLPNSWTMSNAWHKAFATWQRMNAEALEESESIKPRFLDFKIYANARHHNNGFAGNLLPVSFDTDAAGVLTVNAASPGEWEPSKVYIPTGTAGTQGQSQQRELLAVGSNYPGLGATGLDAVSIIDGYAASRGLPNVLDPNAPDDALSVDGFNPQNWLTAIFNEGTEQKEEILEDMVGPLAENNIAPYPFENDGANTDTMYPGGPNQLKGLEVHDVSFITPTTIGGKTRIVGGNFPCGLMAFTWAPNGSSNLVIQVDLVPGPHRGYLAMPMQEM